MTVRKRDGLTYDSPKTPATYHHGTGIQAFLIPLRVIGSAIDDQLSTSLRDIRFHSVLVFDPGTRTTVGVVYRLKKTLLKVESSNCA